MDTTKQYNKALLVMDIQENLLKFLPDSTALRGKIKQAVEHARSKNIPVIYVAVGFREGNPEVSPNYKAFQNLSQMGVFPQDPSLIAKEVAPQKGEVVCWKKRFSAFAGSDLELILRSKQIQELILTGFSTSGIVLSTLREAADKDFVLNVLSDGVADGDEEVHRVLLTKVFPRQADVITVDEWVAKTK